ncbi:MAG: tRNA-dihydrouridine synthase [Eggerthellaceae bacterium]
MAVHGRTAAQFYTGVADWDVVARVKRALSIPVIGNGDVKSGSDAVALVRQTGCDAVMIGRAAQGNPWLFSPGERLRFAARTSLRRLPPSSAWPWRIGMRSFFLSAWGTTSCTCASMSCGI